MTTKSWKSLKRDDYGIKIITKWLKLTGIEQNGQKSNEKHQIPRKSNLDWQESMKLEKVIQRSTKNCKDKIKTDKTRQKLTKQDENSKKAN